MWVLRISNSRRDEVEVLLSLSNARRTQKANLPNLNDESTQTSVREKWRFLSKSKSRLCVSIVSLVVYAATTTVHIRVISPAIWFSGCKQPGIKLCNEFLTSVPLLVRAWRPEQHRFFQHQTLSCCFCVSRPTRARDFNIFQPVAFFCWELYTIKFLTYLCMQCLNGARASYCATEQSQRGRISQKRQGNENAGQGDGFP